MMFVAKFITACGCEKLEERDEWGRMGPPEVIYRAMLAPQPISSYMKDKEIPQESITIHRRLFRYAGMEYYGNRSYVYLYREVLDK